MFGIKKLNYDLSVLKNRVDNDKIRLAKLETQVDTLSNSIHEINLKLDGLEKKPKNPLGRPRKK